jgi:signal peptidase I
VATDPFQAGPAAGGSSAATAPTGARDLGFGSNGESGHPVTGGPLPGLPPETGPEAESADASDGSGTTGTRALARRKRRRRALIEWALVLLVALGVAVLMRTYVVQTFFIPSGSMEPTLNIGDRILVDKLSYHLHAVHRGDIIVFARPPGETLEPGVNDLVKRVIGLPGETISAQNGQVYINGKPLKEPWLPKGVVTDDFGPVHVPQGDYFVMGDNRGFSSDSRVFGPISGKLIVGRVVMRIWPLSHITFF